MKLPRRLTLANAENLHDLRYLPDWRYTGATGPRGDWEQTLNLYLPSRGVRPYPLVMYVHGGAYSAGHKDESYPQELLQTLIDAGFAVGSMNYILSNKGIVPQVWWDFEEAARFLRVHAGQYGLDPNAFGAMGISAGGWLITTSGHADGTTFARAVNDYVGWDSLRGTPPTDPKPIPGEKSFLRNTLSPVTAYPGVSGRWQALAYDLDRCRDRANGFSPALLALVGSNRSKVPPVFEQTGVEWTPAVLVHPYWTTRDVHVPPLTRSGHEFERGRIWSLDGKTEVPAIEGIRDWFRQTLTGPQARTPVPEIWPADRLVEGSVPVSFVTTDPATVVRYTIDGTEPGPAARTYESPFAVPPGTTVRAFSQLGQRRPSRIVSATFVQAGPRQRIIGPTDPELPPGRSGEPYQVRFTASLPGARWSLQGDLRPYLPYRSQTLRYPNGMAIDGEGVLSGTPTTPGTFWVQVWVNDGPGRIASHRDYRWTVTGEAVGPQEAREALAEDQNREIALIKPWREDMLALLRERMQEAGVRLAIHEGEEGRLLLLAPEPQRATALKVLQRLRSERPRDSPVVEP